MRTEDIFPQALMADRAHLVDGDMGRQPCVFYFRKSSGDDFDTQVLRCVQYARATGLRLDTSVGAEGVYFDEDKSGMKAIHRPGYERLVEDILSGALAGRWVVVRDQDRLSRRESSKLEEYHVIAEMGKVRTFESGGREIRDDETTGILAVVNRSEARRTSVRLKVMKELRAIEGVPPTSSERRIGYTRGYTAIVWEEAKVLRRVRRKVVAGQSLTGICTQLRHEGVCKPAGGFYRPSDLGRLLRSPAYAGLRTFSRDITIGGKVIPAGMPVAKGKWPKIFTEEEHHEVVAVLDRNAPWVSDRAPKHLLTGILVCAECGSTMWHGWKYGKPHKDGTKRKQYVYRCMVNSGGCGRVSRNAGALETFLVALTFEAIKRMPTPDVREVERSDEEIERQNQKIREAVEAFKNDGIGIMELAEIRKDAQNKIDSLRKERKTKTTTLPIDDAHTFLNSENVSERRDTIRRMFPSVGVRSGGKGSRFKPDQLVFPEGTDTDLINAAAE